MAIEDILQPKSDDEIYQGLTSSVPDEVLFYKTVKSRKLHLLKRLIADQEVDLLRRNLWRQYLDELSDLRLYINNFDF